MLQDEIKQVSNWEDEIVARLSALEGEKTAAIRELAKHDPESVRQFLTRHENEMAARVSREVNNKLVTGLKNTRRCEASVIHESEIWKISCSLGG